MSSCAQSWNSSNIGSIYSKHTTQPYFVYFTSYGTVNPEVWTVYTYHACVRNVCTNNKVTKPHNSNTANNTNQQKITTIRSHNTPSNRNLFCFISESHVMHTWNGHNIKWYSLQEIMINIGCNNQNISQVQSIANQHKTLIYYKCHH